MATKYVVQVNANESSTPWVSGAKHASLKRFMNVLKGAISGNRVLPLSLDVRNAAVQASGTLTLDTAAGTVGGVINGVTITVTASGGDTATATAIAAAINASSNALVANIVTASALGAVVTVTAVLGGVSGNTVTLAASGTGVTASGARLTSGTETVLSYTF